MSITRPFSVRFAILPAIALATFVGSGASGQSPPTLRQAQDLLQQYKPPAPVPSTVPLPPGPPPSRFGMQKSDSVVVRMMPSSHDVTLDHTDAPYTWPGRALIVWGRADGGAEPYTFKMEYGDGSPADSGSVDYSAGRKPWFIAVAHSYATAGPKFARLTVTDANGHVGTRELPIFVQALTDASTEMLVRRNAAIQDGLRWLYLSQGGDGAFPAWYTYCASTAAA